MTFRLHPGAWAGASEDAELDALRDAAAAVRGDVDGEWDLVRLAGERIGAMAPGNAARHLVGRDAHRLRQRGGRVVLATDIDEQGAVGQEALHRLHVEPGRRALQSRRDMESTRRGGHGDQP